MDMQFGIATVVIILGLGITQIDGGQNEFFAGAGWGTVAMGCLWVAIRMYKSYKKR
ncbi:MAG: hypothetical protein JRZ95_04775 [Nitrososphaerota archaeon]|jgi:hypothetical protein|nr:hypothetical protein [Nitrososphaerota archaeon]